MPATKSWCCCWSSMKCRSGPMPAMKMLLNGFVRVGAVIVVTSFWLLPSLKTLTVSSAPVSLPFGVTCGGELVSSVGSVIAVWIVRSSVPTPPSMYSGPWMSAATWCSCIGKNFSGWFGSVGGACGFDRTLMMAGESQLVVENVTDGNVQPAGTGVPGGGAVQPETGGGVDGAPGFEAG